MAHGLASVTTALGGYGLTWLVQSSALLGLGMLVGSLLKRFGPAVQSGVYRTTLGAVLVCPIASALLAGAGFEGLTLRLSSPRADNAAPVMTAIAEPPPDQKVATFSDHSPVRLPTTMQQEPAPANEPFVAASQSTQSTAGPTPVPKAGDGSDVLAAAAGVVLATWLFGSAALGLRLLLGEWRMRKLRASAVAADADAVALCHRIAERMRVSAPEVLRSPFLFSPCLDGLRRPVILLPEDVGENLRETFVHELAHLVRHDGVWNLLRRLATAVFWMQPLLWVLSRRIEATAEEVCDDYVVQFGTDRARYAGHLLELAGRALPPTAAAGVRMVSLRSMLARRIVRILDSSRLLSTKADTRAVVAMVIVGFAGTLLAGLVGVGGGSRNLLADQPKPGRSATAGDPKPAPFNAATGQAIKTSEQPTAVKHDQGKITARDVPITGRIVDLEGRPIPGVTVRVGSVTNAKEGDLGPWLEAMRRGGPPSWVAYRLLDDGEEKVEREAETDAEGRFSFEGLGAEKRVQLTIAGPTIAYTNLDVVTRRIEPFPARGFENTFGPGTQTIYGADLTFTASPGRVVEGIVRDAKTKTVMKDVGVWSFSFAGSNLVAIKYLKTRTDAEGHFRLAGLPKGLGNKLLVVPNDDQPYFMQDVAVPDPPGIAAVPVEISLHRGIWIEGKITDQETGAPVAGALLHYLPFLDNPFAQATPEFRGGVNRPGSGYQDRYQSKADGSYRLVGLPGRAIVGAVVGTGKPYRQGAGSESIQGMNEHGHFATVNNPIIASRHFPDSMKEINPAEGAETVHLDFSLDPGAKVHLRVVDPQGKPVTGVKTGSRRTRGRYDIEPEAQAEFDVVTLGPGEDRMVWLVHEGRKLGRVIHVNEGDDKKGPVVVTLEPAATIAGRIVDPDGNPVSGATIRPGLKPGGDFSLSLPRVASGTDGRFTVPNVPVGCEYDLVAEAGTMIKERRFAFTRAKVKPGETTEVGDIKFKND